jgi:chemotaxis protein CheX
MGKGEKGGFMDERLTKAFSSAAVGAFKDMFGLAASAGPVVELVPGGTHGWDITGLVGLAGQGQGIVGIRLTRSLVAKLLVHSGVVAAEGEMRELEGGLVGELTNIIAGQAISALAGLDIEIAPPVVIRGPNHSISWPNIAPVLQMPFKLPDGAFEIDLCMKV